MMKKKTPVESLKIVETARLEEAVDTLAQSIGLCAELYRKESQKEEPDPGRLLEKRRNIDHVLTLRNRFYDGEEGAALDLNKNMAKLLKDRVFAKEIELRKNGTRPETIPMTREQQETIYLELKDNILGRHVRVGDQYQPAIILVGGQPGAGKTGLLSVAQKELMNRNHIPCLINSDEYRARIPGFAQIFLENPKMFAETVDAPVRAWTERLLWEAGESRRNVVYETTLRNKDKTANVLRRFRALGYRTEICVAVAPELVSLLGIFLRYERQLSHKGIGRWTCLDIHDKACQDIPQTLRSVQEENLADRITLFNRAHEVLFDTAQTPGASSALALLSQQNQPWTDNAQREYAKGWARVRNHMHIREGKEHVAPDYAAFVEEMASEALLLKGSTFAECGTVYRGEIETITPHFLLQKTSLGYVAHARSCYEGLKTPEAGELKNLIGIEPQHVRPYKKGSLCL